MDPLQFVYHPFLRELLSHDERSYRLRNLLGEWNCLSPTFLKQLDSWFSQFSYNDQNLAAKILSNIKYYSDTNFYNRVALLGDLIGQRIHPDDFRHLLVVIPSRPGDSAQLHVHPILKFWRLNRNQVVTTNEICDRETENCHVVAFNDTYGTGEQFIKDIWPSLEKVECKNRLITGITICHKALEVFRTLPNVQVIPDTPEQSAESIFTLSELNTIRELGKRIYPDHPLGYGGCGILVAYYFQCPNNSLPLIWADGSNNRVNESSYPWSHLFRYLPKGAGIKDDEVIGRHRQKLTDSGRALPDDGRAPATGMVEQSASSIWRPRKTALDPWKDKLNLAFTGEAEIVTLLRREPRYKYLGPYSIPSSTASEIEELRRHVGEPGTLTNQYHAILTEDTENRIRDCEDPLMLEYYDADYATVRVLEHHHHDRVPSLYAGALVCCTDLGKVYLHRRSKNVDKFKSHFHTMSGNFITQGDLLWDSDLRVTARREIFEEMNVAIDVDAKRYPAVLIHETRSGRWLLSYLGVDITRKEASAIRKSGEGKPVKVSFKDLGIYLDPTKRWVSSGRLNVLAWLALGAVTVGGRGFDPDIARECLERWAAGSSA